MHSSKLLPPITSKPKGNLAVTYVLCVELIPKEIQYLCRPYIVDFTRDGQTNGRTRKHVARHAERETERQTERKTAKKTDR